MSKDFMVDFYKNICYPLKRFRTGGVHENRGFHARNVGKKLDF